MEESVVPAGYRYGGGYVGLPYEMPKVAPTFEVDGETLTAKTEFHMSIFCVKKYAPEMAAANDISVEEAEQIILQAASVMLTKFPISIQSFRDEFRLAEERDKKTVVVMVDAENLEPFFEGMRQALQMEFPTQPTHITIYTRETGGIGLPDQDEVTKLTKLLSAEETQRLKMAINFDELNNR